MGSSTGFRNSPKSSKFANHYLLEADNSNKYKVDKRLEKSIDFTNMIPLLRTHQDQRTF